jgi:hypothetical protein
MPGGTKAARRSARASRKVDLVVKVAFAVLLLYILVLVENGPRTQDERFPFFNWSLFSGVPGPERESYGLRLTEVDGARLEEPVYYENAEGIIATRRSPDAYQLIQAMGKATKEGRPVQAASARETLETRYMQGLTDARYELVSRTYDVLERFECECYREEDAMAEFTLGR